MPEPVEQPPVEQPPVEEPPVEQPPVEQPPVEQPPVEEPPVSRRMFLAVGALIAVIAIVYWFTAYEDAGTVLLALSAVLALWCGAFLWLQARPRPAGAGETEAADAHFLPHASLWPFTIGLGGALIVNGLVLGVWLAVPGLGLLVLGIAGFIGQTRRRAPL